MRRDLCGVALLLVLGLVATGCRTRLFGDGGRHDLSTRTDLAMSTGDLAGTRPAGDMSIGPDLAFKPPGKCFGKTGFISCASDGNCGGSPFATCQEGVCCSGTLDPTDCTCHCAGGPACPGGQLCCPGACMYAPDLGVLMCRDQYQCFYCGPA
jgi:hypothetical protein